VGNSASCASGGISIGSSLTVRNSTISGNSTDAEGGGIFQSAGPDATFTMVNSTVTGNDTSSDNAGGGIQFFGAATIVYSTIVNNTATNEANLSGYTGDPGLAALASNGGPTETREPLSGSPLVDAIPTGSCQNDGAAGITTDQGSYPGRPRTVVTSAPSRFSPHRRVRARVRFRVRSVGRPERPERP